MFIRTEHFRVFIAPECSGLEGAGLMLAFGVTLLWLFRQECRFPQCLILLPGGIVLLFLLNSVRIAALVLIGNAGARQIAAGGFHSQAGWIAFNLIALAFVALTMRFRVFTNEAAAPTARAARAAAADTEEPKEHPQP
jgi:exosortase/archaeosortase family protein